MLSKKALKYILLGLFSTVAILLLIFLFLLGRMLLSPKTADSNAQGTGSAATALSGALLQDGSQTPDSTSALSSWDNSSQGNAPQEGSSMTGSGSLAENSSIAESSSLAGNSSIPGNSSLTGNSSLAGNNSIAGNSSIPGNSSLQGERDYIPPTISGTHDIQIYVGQSIAYFDSVTVSDDTDPSPALTVDADNVNPREPGFYFATYIARDQSGNETRQQIQVVVQPVSQAGISDEDVRPLAEEVLGEIITEGMTDTEKARAIFDWNIRTIYYLYDSAERDVLSGAYAGFKNHAGDCYIYYACAKYMLDYCGIPNVSVERSDSAPDDTHYWLLVNLGSGWYHYDASPKPSTAPFDCFMKTDEEVYAYAHSRPDGRSNYFDFDASLYIGYPRETEPFQ